MSETEPSDVAALRDALQRAGTAKASIEAGEAQARVDAARTATNLQRLQRRATARLRPPGSPNATSRASMPSTSSLPPGNAQA